ncbi:MAG: lipopolysaccharide kinase InaA family protein [Planctomycetota bacterium]
MILWKHPMFADDPRSDSELYDAIASLASSDDFHAKQGRSTGRCSLPTPRGPRNVYVKRYYTLPWWQRRFFSLDQFPGPLEQRNLDLAKSLGILVPEPILAGADRSRPCKSFLVIGELEGFVPLHLYLPRRFARETGSIDELASWNGFKRRLSEKMVDICRRLHGASLYHRDLYLCHFFIRETSDSRTRDIVENELSAPRIATEIRPADDVSRSIGRRSDVPSFDLALIDFGRLLQSSRQRWLVKDLAQLLFSADLPGITRDDQIRFLELYLETQSSAQGYQRLAHRIQSKAARYHRHNARAAA